MPTFARRILRSRLTLWKIWNSRDVKRVCALKKADMCKAYPVKISTVLSLPPSFSCVYSCCICACMRLDIFLCAWMCVCLRVWCVRLCVCVSLRPCLFVFACLRVCVSACLRVCVSVCLFVCASVCLCLCLCLYLSVHMCVCVFALCACGGSRECGFTPV